jgi:hypothetical protein
MSHCGDLLVGISRNEFGELCREAENWVLAWPLEWFGGGCISPPLVKNATDDTEALRNS